jgi:DNA-binding MarR family transcriptional regulator
VPTKKSASVGTVDLLKRAELAVRGCAEALLVPFGLTPAQFLVLFRLKHSTTPVSSADLARAAGIRPQSVVDLIGPLERRGLIKRREAPEHRRILRITLSAAGEQLFARALPAAAQLETELLANLNVREITGLRVGLEKLLANAETHESHPAMRRSAAAATMRSGTARKSSKPAAMSRKRRKNAAE